MRAILVSVEYSDLLAITLPRNKHHFESVTVVTSYDDRDTKDVCTSHGVECLATNAFYLDGAIFNKWKALEQGLDWIGRDGWLCVMDADVIWPEVVSMPELEPTKLYGPLRRMLKRWPEVPIPDESEWDALPLHSNFAEWAGFTQIFHADDPHLGEPPWHETNWKHAGGADSFFQFKWSRHEKIRLPFEVLHLGRAGKNWCGRAEPFADGTRHAESNQRAKQLRDFIHGRNGSGVEQFDREKI